VHRSATTFNQAGISPASVPNGGALSAVYETNRAFTERSRNLVYNVSVPMGAEDGPFFVFRGLWAETYFNTTGSRDFTVWANNQEVTTVDLVAAVGFSEPYQAIVRLNLSAAANILVEARGNTDLAFISGMEVLVEPAVYLSPTTVDLGMHGRSACEVLRVRAHGPRRLCAGQLGVERTQDACADQPGLFGVQRGRAHRAPRLDRQR
jgi:hypothetical protein